ncbi:cysteine sulfinic acid decarboxylase isoform X4 [Choloepus didactylus]|uniref:cysteine sulfinic acid decarboxylase isoform X4 n=1 Tax=Choloepus didactylus TaxID=27675 RepID=UPI0018A068D0|nr:cysteine sulfinic acid decarboxylase isoform X4 [Choloepus didactylus]XP_037703562.1 cysteine sulfinic acid decarboxylase isoform X4 [Choloepus didactylus]
MQQLYQHETRPELRRRKAWRPSLGAWGASRTQTGSVCPVQRTARVLRVRPKVRKLSAKVESKETKPTAALSLLPAVRRSAHRTNPEQSRRAPRSARGTAASPTPQRLLQAPAHRGNPAAAAALAWTESYYSEKPIVYPASRPPEQRPAQKDFILMAESKPLLSLDGDSIAAEALLQDVFEIVVDEVIRKGTSASEKVCEWKEPEELKQLLDLELRSQGESQEQILERCQAVIRYSVKTCHPRFFNQLFSGLDPHSLAGRIITESLNTSQYTYEIAPVFVLMEEEVLKTLRALVGWSSGDGVFCPGGSISNMYALNLARYQRYPDCKQRGLRTLPPLALFASQECHYSIKKGAAFLGLGTDSVRVVKADERGKMIPEDLERQISLAEAEGAVPFLVSATSGTTVLGAFDPLEAIADICQHHGLWLHVDAAWGGSVLLSQTHRHLLDGIQRADSVAWNPHKLLTAGLQCSALLLRDTSNLLKRCHGSQASYLFQQDKFYDVALDTGDKVVQCGRRVDCLKLWLMWKAQGGQGLEQRVDRAFALARYLVEEMKKREGFELVMEPEFVNVCFWFVPPTLQGKQDSPDYSERLAKVAPVLKERMVKEGSMMIGYQPHGTRGNFFRVVVANPALTRADMDFLLKELERLGQDL